MRLYGKLTTEEEITKAISRLLFGDPETKQDSLHHDQTSVTSYDIM